MTEFIVQYFFNILAVAVAPVCGFAIGQIFKSSQDEKPKGYRVAILNGSVTAIFAFMLWPGDIIEKFKIATTVGAVSPFIVFAWFAVATKTAPKAAESLKGSNGELMIIPGLKIRKKSE